MYDKKMLRQLENSGYVCPNCKAIFEEDDFAFLIETGKCQYCHEDITEESIENSYETLKDQTDGALTLAISRTMYLNRNDKYTLLATASKVINAILDAMDKEPIKEKEITI